MLKVAPVQKLHPVPCRVAGFKPGKKAQVHCGHFPLCRHHCHLLGVRFIRTGPGTRQLLATLRLALLLSL